MGGVPNESELSLKMPNGSVIYFSGASDSTEIEKFRGLGLKLCYIDEAQSFKPYIERLIDDVISKALFDYNGQLKLIGTPGPVPAGFFYEVSKSKAWKHHHWTMHENYFLTRKSGKTADELIRQDCERKGVGFDDPAIRRECFGEWVVDPNSLVFRYSEETNNFEDIDREGFTYVLGIDVGFSDADAIAVIGWGEHQTQAYLVQEVVKRKQGITELADQLDALISRYAPISIVMDTGGLGKKIAEELKARRSLPIKAADKAGKFAYIELLNDAMRTGRFMAKKGSQFAQDCYMVEWEQRGASPKVSDRFHSDICDAVLYGFREAQSYLEMPVTARPEFSLDAYRRDLAEELEQVADNRVAQRLAEERDW